MDAEEAMEFGDHGGAGWAHTQSACGVMEIYCESWRGFSNLINSYLFEFAGYVYRGHSSKDWELLPTLDRLVESEDSWVSAEEPCVRQWHLDNFKYSVRGRRGTNPPKLEQETDWWALGQHYGLATPLLDWTLSPFVAAFFAFEEASVELSEHCVVYALSKPSVMEKNSELSEQSDIDEPIHFVTPLTDDNTRLISQQGLFTFAAPGVTVEDWVHDNFEDRGEHDGVVLIKILIPASEKHVALQNLNRMNVNHLSLFPDLTGASQFSNLWLKTQNYL